MKHHLPDIIHVIHETIIPKSIHVTHQPSSSRDIHHGGGAFCDYLSAEDVQKISRLFNRLVLTDPWL